MTLTTRLEQIARLPLAERWPAQLALVQEVCCWPGTLSEGDLARLWLDVCRRAGVDPLAGVPPVVSERIIHEAA